MALFTWNDKFSVSVKDMDNQHKVLFDIINELYQAMNENRSKDILGKIISRLMDYTKTHFKNEEIIMERYAYPDIASQKKEHMTFVNKIIEYKNGFESGKVTMTVSMTSFLKDWLLNHISVVDKKYGSFFNSKGVH